MYCIIHACIIHVYVMGVSEPNEYEGVSDDIAGCWRRGGVCK